MSRNKAGAYHGVRNVKFAPRVSGAYAEGEKILSVLYAKNLNPSSLLEAQEQYADDQMLFRVPNDKGYDIELGTTAPDTELEKAAGYALEGASGLISAGLAYYARGALYYEFTERDADGLPSQVKCWVYNVELGKGTGTHTSDASAVEFGSYSYPMRVYGDPLMDGEGSAAYVDERGVGRTAFMYTCRPGDTGYETFGASVPVPKLATAAAG